MSFVVADHFDHLIACTNDGQPAAVFIPVHMPEAFTTSWCRQLIICGYSVDFQLCLSGRYSHDCEVLGVRKY